MERPLTAPGRPGAVRAAVGREAVDPRLELGSELAERERPTALRFDGGDERFRVDQPGAALPEPEVREAATGRFEHYAPPLRHLEPPGDLFEVGKLADLIVIDTSGTHLTPLYDVYSALVYAANPRDVRTTIIHGRIVIWRTFSPLARMRTWLSFRFPKIRFALTPDKSISSKGWCEIGGLGRPRPMEPDQWPRCGKPRGAPGRRRAIGC